MESLVWGGFYPGVLGEIIGLHGSYYHARWGLDQSFEIEVGRELTEFAAVFDSDRDCFVAARIAGRLAGTISVDGKDASGQGARLRWFLVAPDLVGKGLGKALLDRAMAFIKMRAYPKAYLWTYSGLHAARALYERQGFSLAFEQETAKWGRDITVQRFEAMC